MKASCRRLASISTFAVCSACAAAWSLLQRKIWLTKKCLRSLKMKLAEMGKRVPPRSLDFTTRMPIDRAFSMKGFGSVVTGTLVSGKITEGDELELLPSKVDVRVRGLQVHNKAVHEAQAGQRTAVNLAGTDTSQIERGMVLAPAGR